MFTDMDAIQHSPIKNLPLAGGTAQWLSTLADDLS